MSVRFAHGWSQFVLNLGSLQPDPRRFQRWLIRTPYRTRRYADRRAFAYRRTVRYGMLSGPLIQVVSGLDPGDRVIVTDMSQWEKAERVKLE
jgi:hypothetical protein